LDYTRFVTIDLTYTRVSTFEQSKEGLSLDMQARETVRLVDQRRSYLGGRFSDVLSGARSDRPGYQALLAEIRRLRAAGEQVGVVVWRLDRFGRDLEERARSWKELAKLEVTLHSVSEGGHAIDETTAYAMAFAAQVQLTSIRQNIKGALKNARNLGWWTSGTCPYGYVWRPRTEDERARGSPKGVLDVDPIPAARVAEAFQRLADGTSAGSVHRWLASLSDQERGGRAMHRRSVFLMFKAPVYMGRFEEDGPAGQWPAIVDAETWHKAQHVFDGHKPPGGKRAVTGRYLLSGFLKCSVCGHPMVGSSVNTSKRRQARYRCKRREYGTPCDQTVTVERVDQEALRRVSELVDWLVDPQKRAQLVARINARRAKVLPNEERERRQIERERERERTRLMQAIDKWNDGRLSDADYYAYRATVEQRVKAHEERLASLLAAAELSEPEPELPLTPAPTWLHILRNSVDVEARRRVLSVFVTGVIARRTGWGRYVVDINLTPLGEWLAMLTPPGLEEVS
jgi:DNA invertase Pin-like site-specific DNA recombinase